MIDIVDGDDDDVATTGNEVWEGLSRHAKVWRGNIHNGMRNSPGEFVTTMLSVGQLTCVGVTSYSGNRR